MIESIICAAVLATLLVGVLLTMAHAAVSVAERISWHDDDPEIDVNDRSRATDCSTALSFDDAIAIAKGCFDYGGGYRENEAELAIFHHGIQTVVNAMNGAKSSGLSDMQSRVLHRFGSVE